MKTAIRTALTFTVACFLLLGVTAASPVPGEFTTPAPVAADLSVPDIEAASHPCSTGLMGTCQDVDDEDMTCVLFNPYLPSQPYVREGACDTASEGCGVQ